MLYNYLSFLCRRKIIKRKHLFGTRLTLSTVTLILAACGNNKKDDSAKNSSSSSSMFKSAVPIKSIKQGGTVNVAIQTDTSITCIFLNDLAVSTTDFWADLSHCLNLITIINISKVTSQILVLIERIKLPQLQLILRLNGQMVS